MFTNSPEMQGYDTKDVEPVNSLDFRTGVTGTTPSTRLDAGTINTVIRGDKNNPELETRPGALMTLGPVASGLSNPQIRGAYLWEEPSGSSIYFVVIDTKLYTSITSGNTWVNSVTFSNNVGTPVGFTEFLDGTNAKSLILVDGYEGYKITYSGGVLTCTKIIDANFPSPHLPFPIFIDGYLFLAKSGTGDIYNSNLNDPTTWTAGSFISSELYPDPVQALVKIDNYMVAVGSTGSEYFYDAGNSVGSPMARYQGGILPFGTQLPYTLASNKNSMIMIANNNDGEACLMLVQGLKYTDITPEWLIPCVEYSRASMGSSTYKIRGNLMRVYGQEHYTLRLPTGTANADFGFLALNMKHGFWSEWTGANYGQFPVYATCPAVLGTSLELTVGLDASRTNCYAGLLDTSGNVAYDQFGNTTSVFPVEVRTKTLTFETMNRKSMHRLGIEVENANGGNTATTFGVYCCDDDNTWTSMGTLTATGSLKFPFLTQLGSFRERKIKLVGNNNNAVRIKGLQVRINKGVT